MRSPVSNLTGADGESAENPDQTAPTGGTSEPIDNPTEEKQEQNKQKRKKEEKKKEKKRRTVRRIIKRALLSAVLLIVVVIALTWVSLGNLDHSWLSGPIKGTVEADFGLLVDYDELSVAPLSGLHGANLQVRTPGAYAAYAPLLLRIGSLDVSWDFWPLVSGHLQISAFELRGLKLSLVVDEDGNSSLDALVAGLESPTSDDGQDEEAQAGQAEEIVLLSHLLQDALPAIAVASMRVEEVELEVVLLRDGAAHTRISLVDLCLHSRVDAEPGVLSAESDLGPCPGAEAVKLTVEEEPGTPRAQQKELLARVTGTVRTPSETSIELVLEGDLLRQNLLEEAALPTELVRARASATFAPEHNQTRVRIDHLSLLGGAFTAELAAQLNDRPDGTFVPVVEHSKGQLAAERMVQFFPFAFENVNLAHGTVEYEITGLVVDAETGIVEKGSARVRADIESLSLAMDGQKVALAGATFELDGRIDRPLDGELSGELWVGQLDVDGGSEGQVALSELSVAVDGDKLVLNTDNPLASRGTVGLEIALAGVKTAIEGQKTSLDNLLVKGTLSGAPTFASSGEVPLGRVSLFDGATKQRVELRDLLLTWQIDQADPALAKPTGAKVTVNAASAAVREPGQLIQVTKPSAEMDAVVKSADKFDARVAAPLPRITMRSSDGLVVISTGAELVLNTENFALNQDDPLLSRGTIALTANLPRVDVRTPEVLASARRFTMSADAVLSGSQPLSIAGTVPIGVVNVRDNKTQERLLRINGGTLSLQVADLVLDPDDSLQTRGKVAAQAALPAIALPSAGLSITVPSTDLALTLHGKQKKYLADLRVVLRSLSAGGKQYRTDIVTTVNAAADLRKPHLRVDMGLNGPRGPAVRANMTARYASAQRKLVYNALLTGERLGAIEQFLPEEVRNEHQLDWAALRFRVSSYGDISEVIRRLADGIEPIVADQPLAVLRGQQHLTLEIEGVDYRSAEQTVNVPELTVAIDGTEKAGPVSASLGVRAAKPIVVKSDGDTIAVVGFNKTVNISSAGPFDQSRVDLSVNAEIERVDQTIVEYPVEKATLVASAHLDRLDSLRVDELRFENRAGGTELTAKLAMDGLVRDSGSASGIPGRQALTGSGRLKQDLRPVAVVKNGPRMRGRVEMPFSVESGDLSAFLVAARATLDDVHIELPDAELAVEGFNGDIPVITEVAVLPNGGVEILSGPAKNLYSRTRFLDVHPFLRGKHYLTVDRVTWQDETIGPVAGNFQLDRDTVSLDQLELGYRGGNITGQLVVDYQGGNPRMLFRGNITGVRPSNSDQVLDANAALSLSLAELDLEGRIQIVRVSRQHLLGVLDVLDPYHEDVDVNRVRLGLKFGFPKFVRLRMKDGFLSAKIELGGAAKVVRIDEIRGIALGPLINLYVAPYLPESLGQGPRGGVRVGEQEGEPE
ncbi:MAG: hypothetical protein MJE77_36395 [Proteobacteria bacterium]|nr:hypothetical protein [Pseudomonadota bacterium]